MEFWKRSSGVKGWLAVITALCCALLVAACGGGGGSPGTTSGTSGGITAVAIELVDANGRATKDLTNATPILARARFTRSGQPISGQIVTFATTGAKVTMSPASGSVLTDASGVATVTLVPTDPNYQSGDAGAIVATASSGGTTYTASATYQLGVRNTTINLVAPSTNPVSINAFGTTEIAADVFVNGILYTTQPVNVSFNSFCVSQGKATMPGVVRTINGRARALYTDNGCGQDDIVTVTVSGSAAPATVRVAIAPASAGSIRFTSTDNTTIAIKGNGTTTRPENTKLTFTVVDMGGNPVAGKLVNFSVFPADVTLTSNVGVTDATGKVSVVANSGTKATTFRVTASISGGPSVVSDSISVSGGSAVQAAMSLSAEAFQIPGQEHDNEVANVNVLLADTFGNPVRDGAAVNFTTDSGAVAGNCITANGGCSVVFRSQNPRFGANNTAGKRPGFATITATTSSEDNLTGRLGIFMSFDRPSFAEVVGLSQNASYNANTRTFTASDCNPITANLKISDLYRNPVSTGAKLTIDKTDKVTLDGVYPGEVPNVTTPVDINGVPTLDPAKMAADQGTEHLIFINMPACNAAGNGSEVGTFGVKVETTVKSSGSTFALTFPFAVVYKK